MSIISKIDHIGVIVRNLDNALEVYSEAFGLRATRVEVSTEFQVRMAFLPVGESFIELCEPIGPGEDWDFLEKSGEGFQHIAYKVQNIEDAIRHLHKKVVLIGDGPREGAAKSKVVFIEPRSTFNFGTELVERTEDI